jgi:hypothetical protein
MSLTLPTTGTVFRRTPTRRHVSPLGLTPLARATRKAPVRWSLTLPTREHRFWANADTFLPRVDVAGEGIVGSPGPDGASPYLPGNIVFGERRHADTPIRFSPGVTSQAKATRQAPVRTEPHPTCAAPPKAISTLSDLT